MGKVMERIGRIVGFKGWLIGKGRINSAILDIITEINNRCIYIQVFFKHNYNVKTCIFTISALYKMICLNFIT